MKKYLFPIFWLIYFSAFATDYYVSSEGLDSADGLAPETSWKSISKINARFPFLKPGDRVLLKRGDVFSGTLRISSSGLPGNPIVIGAYGEGPDPVISGFTDIRTWKKHKSGIYTSHFKCESPVNLVTVNEINTPKGRWPDNKLLSVDSHNARISFTDDELSSDPDWTGAQAVIRKNAYIWDAVNIIKHKDNVIIYSGGSDYEINDRYGYFIQNDIKTLNLHGEWLYKGNTFYMFFGTDDPYKYSVRVSSTDQLVYLNGASHITIENLSFEGANTYSLQIRNSGYITIQNCKINHTGNTAIFGPWWGNSPGCRIINNKIENSASNGIKLNGDHTNATISGNRILNTGLAVGMGGNGDGTYNAVHVLGDNCLIKNNIIENSGYMGINFRGENSVVANNFISNFNILKNDGGGIYTYAGSGNPKSGQKITGNIVLNGIGMSEGIPGRTADASGIYIDDRSCNIEITGNTVSDCSTAGIYLHNAHEIDISCNNIYNNGHGSYNHGSQLLMVHDNYSPNDPVRNVRLYDNVLFSAKGNPGIIAFSTIKNDVGSFGSSDNNYFVSSPANNKIIRIWEKGWRGPALNLSLDEWQIKTGQDLFTKTLTDIVNVIVNQKQVRDSDKSDFGTNKYNNKEVHMEVMEARLEFNSSAVTKTIHLDKTYYDLKGLKYDKYIELTPYSSVILIRLKDEM